MPETNTRPHPAGIVTLTTDFGLQDPFVGIMKGVITQNAPAVNVIDISHEVPPYYPEIGGLWLGLCYRWFARGTVHVAVIDPGVGTDRRIACIYSDGHTFLAPDNGLAGEIVRHLHDWEARVVDLARLELPVPSATFHGRDIFAPVAAGLACGDLQAVDLGQRVRDLQPSGLPRPQVSETAVQGQLLIADHFGNLMSNIRGPSPAGWSDPVVRAGDRTMRLVATYDEASRGELVGIFNSFGLLEIACPRGRASDAAGLTPGMEIQLQSAD